MKLQSRWSSRSPHHCILIIDFYTRALFDHMISSRCCRKSVQKQGTEWNTVKHELEVQGAYSWASVDVLFDLCFDFFSFFLCLQRCANQKMGMMSYNYSRYSTEKMRAILIMRASIPTMFQLAVNVPHILNSRYFKLVNLQSCKKNTKRMTKVQWLSKRYMVM